MSINGTPNPYNYTPAGTPSPSGTPAPAPSQIDVTRELSGVNDTGVLGELLTEGTQHLADANKFFAMQKFVVSGLLAENNQAVGSNAVISAPSSQNPNYVLGADDMYVAGDPGVGGKGNDYKYLPIDVKPGYYTMLSTGVDGGNSKITVNGHVESINPEGNKAFTEYGFVVQEPEGKKTQATLSGGQLTIVDANGQSRKLLPPDSYTVGNPNDPTARFYYADVPGAGENGKAEKRLMVDYYEKPAKAVTDELIAKGANPDEVSKLRSKTTMSYGFRQPDGVNTYASPEGVGAGTPKKTTANGVKTYYDSHYAEDEHHTVTLCPPTPGPTPVAANQKARIWGDPHIDNADGSKYNFQEQGIYNVLNDKGVNVNAKLIAGPTKATLIGEMGMALGDRTVNIQADGTVTLGYKDASIKPASVILKDGETVNLGAKNGTIRREGDHVYVTTDEYRMQVDTNRNWKGVQYMNMDIWSKAGGVKADGVMPSGLLGETFDADNIQETGIDKAAADYSRANLYSTVKAPSPAPAPTPVAAKQTASLVGEQPLNDADGGSITAPDKPGVYNLLNDQSINLNANYSKTANGKNMVDKLGLTVGNKDVTILVDGRVAIGPNNGTAGQTGLFTLKEGESLEISSNPKSTITRKGDQLTIVTPEYNLVVGTNKGVEGSKHLDVTINSKAAGVNADKKTPTGLLGETFDADQTKQTQSKKAAATYTRDSLFGVKNTAPAPTPATNPSPTDFQTLINNLLKQLLALLASWGK